MGQLETIPAMEQAPVEPFAASQSLRRRQWKTSAVVVDIATLGSGTLLAAVINAGLVFVVPKLISVEDFGYWRMFALYAGYVGFLHFGFADGALLRWAGRPLTDIQDEILPALKYLFWQHTIVLGPLCIASAFLVSGPSRFVAIALGIYALIFNLVTVLQFALQGAKAFRPVAISTVIAPAIFLCTVMLWHLEWVSGYREITALYVCGWLIALLFLLYWVEPGSGSRIVPGAITLGKGCIQAGWAIVAANTAVMMIVFADRLAVSWAASIHDFAQYSMAASAMAVPITVIQACSKVFFSHLAGMMPSDRQRMYGISSRMLLVAWAILLPYYFALDLFIHHFLPKYVPSLAYARILLLAIPFLAAIQILQMSYVYLNGMQKKFLVQTVVVLATTLGTVSLVAFGTRSMQMVAGIQVGILGSWWVFNEWTLRPLTGRAFAHSSMWLFVYGVTALIYWTATGLKVGAVIALSGYGGLMVTLLLLRRDTWLMLKPRRSYQRDQMV